MSSKHTVVVGGGVIGACTAYYLAARGGRVTLLELNELCSGSSKGNAGQVTPGHLPLPQPGTMARNIRWLFKRSSPLYVKPRFDPALFDWLLRFARACNARHLRKSTELLCRLGEDAWELFDELADKYDFGYRKKGRLEVCRSEKSLAAVRKEAALLKSFGFDHEVIDGRDLPGFEPSLTDEVAGAVYYPQSGDCDPEQLTIAMCRAAQSLGADVREKAGVADVSTHNGRVTSVLLDEEEIPADAVVLACGAWNGRLMRRLGLRMKVQPGKGYHVDLDRPDPCPGYPVVFVQEKIFINPFPNCLRLAGTMELSGFNLNQIPDRLDALHRGAMRYIPSMNGEKIQSRWCHLRPMTPDGLPVIGVSPKLDNVWVATGHGMLGITQAPSTGKLIADWIFEGKPKFDVTDLRPNRF